MESLARACEQVAATNSRLKKVAAVASYLRGLDDTDFARAVRFLTGVPVEGAKLALGGAALRDAAVEASGWDIDLVRLCSREVGDSGEAIGLLMHGRTESRDLTLADAEQAYQRIAVARRTALKHSILCEVFGRARPLAIKYFIKVITGNLRIGLQEKMVEEAVAAATGATLDDVRAANNRLGNLAKVALAARGGKLEEIEARLFHPLDFMLAKPIEQAPALAEATEWLVEDKYDGIRAQVHFENGQVKIFTRGLEDATVAFPEIVAAMATLDGSAAIDGEILAWRNERALAFTVLQQRIARKKVSDELRARVPVTFMGYDLLYRNGRLLVDAPLEERRALLEQLPILVSPQRRLTSVQEIDHLFVAARARGNEGLILKRLGTLYEPAKRTGSWIKVKKAFGTLDVVITAAEQGHGRRATVLSDYTFAVRDGDRFLNVGKAYSGLTDEEIRELTRILRGITTERFSRVLLVKPEIVLEVAFDGVQKSPRHKSGYALRFPRILRWRQDKTPGDADTLEAVRALYEASLT